MKAIKYIVIWDNGYSQGDLTKKEALKIASELLVEYSSVIIKKQ